MKLSINLKRSLYERLCNILMGDLPDDQFNEAVIALERIHGVERIVPYGMFENQEILSRLEKSEPSKVFAKWVDKETKGIPKDKNKGRKLLRQFDSMLSNCSDVLVYTLAVPTVFNSAVMSFFISEEEDYGDFVLIPDKGRFNTSLRKIRNYMACIFVVEMVSDTRSIESLLSLFINSPDEELINQVIQLGLWYQDFEME